jgi:hypothetical protein
VPSWTVLLKVPSGLHAEVIEADVAEYSADGSMLEFRRLGPIVDVAKIAASMDAGPPKTPEDGERLLRELFDALGGIHVASFPKGEVAGYFRGTRGRIELAVSTGGLHLPSKPETHNPP